jgi:hypothetical protein
MVGANTNRAIAELRTNLSLFAVARRSEQSLAHSAISAFSKIKIPIYSQASCTFTARNRDYLLVYAYKMHAHEVYAREMHL